MIRLLGILLAGAALLTTLTGCDFRILPLSPGDVAYVTPYDCATCYNSYYVPTEVYYPVETTTYVEDTYYVDDTPYVDDGYYYDDAPYADESYYYDDGLSGVSYDENGYYVEDYYGDGAYYDDTYYSGDVYYDDSEED